MDFRVDQTILANKPAESDIVLGYGFSHYQISQKVNNGFN